ncbi:unnamed protein product, partial [Ranitomeya imitator]
MKMGGAVPDLRHPSEQDRPWVTSAAYLQQMAFISRRKATFVTHISPHAPDIDISIMEKRLVNVLKELERRKADLNSVTESSAALQCLVEGSENIQEEKLCVLNAGWSRVRTWTEDWCNTLLNHQSQMEIFDENVAHISTWLYQAEALLDEIEKKPANKKEEIVKRLLSELDDVSLRVDSVRDHAGMLMSSRGTSCRQLVEPKVAELNRNFEKVSQHLTAAKILLDQDPGAQATAEEPFKPEPSAAELESFETELLSVQRVLEKCLQSPSECEKV